MHGCIRGRGCTGLKYTEFMVVLHHISETQLGHRINSGTVGNLVYKIYTRIFLHALL